MSSIMSRVEHWDDESEFGHSILVTLKRGWAFFPNESHLLAEHVGGFDTAKEAKKAIRDAQPCSCEYCKGEVK